MASAPHSRSEKSCRIHSSGRFCRDTVREAGDKARGRRAVPTFGEHLMHGATCEPALQRRVRLGMT